jgi:hypothetical protein
MYSTIIKIPVMNDNQEERSMANRRKSIWRTCVLAAHTLPLLWLPVYHVTLSSVLLSFDIYRLMLRTEDSFVSSVNSRSRFLEFPLPGCSGNDSFPFSLAAHCKGKILSYIYRSV